MLKQPHIILLLLCCLLFTHAVEAQQSQKELELKRKKLEENIAYTNHLLDQTRKSKENTVVELHLINNKINDRNELVATLKKELYKLDNKITQTQSVLQTLNAELKSLKEEYIRVAYNAYKYSSSYNRLIFLFSADDMNQAYQRLRYLDQISAFIRTEAEDIKVKEAQKEAELATLQEQQQAKKILLDKESEQVYLLEREKIQKNNLHASLNGKEKELRKSLRQQEDEARKLDAQIQKIIAEETAPKKSAKPGTKYELTPAEKKLADSFYSNKGKLPWPTERGLISNTFGVHPHPVLKRVQTKNNGIDIICGAQSEARCVFDGTVVSVLTITTTNMAIIVKHGNYFTVYSNLDEVYVRKGDPLTTKQIIGRIHTNLKGKTELHFEVWREKELQNPSYWLLSK